MYGNLRLLLAASLLLWLGCRGGDTVHITNASEFIDFSRNVDAGITYEGTTVFLDNDISFLGESFSPIGTRANPFMGTFDGQGHTLSNVLATSSNRDVGLFGASTGGCTVQNLILDSTCSFKSTFST